MLNRALPLLVLCLATPAIAHGEAGRGPSEPPVLEPAAPEQVDVDEVLRNARRDLLALVARDSEPSDGLQPTAAEPGIVLGSPPASLSSTLPPPEPPTVGTVPELGWLRGLALPDIPVRWDDRLIRMLEYYKNDGRGRALLRSLFGHIGTYGPMIRAKLREAKLPEDLVYVAMVESAFDPKARSDVGALGMWQLMPAPASEYGLEITRWVDQRMSPEPSTDAAIKFLHDAYVQLGSWPLAMAAFNMGYGALLRAIQKYNTNDFWLLASFEAGLPYETVTYVTRVMAFAIAAHNRARFGLADLPADSPVETEQVQLPGGTNLKRIAHAAGVDVATLAALNPELKKTRLPPDVKSWTVRLPAQHMKHFREKWGKQLALLPPHREYTLRLGERLSDVADRYGTTLAKLLKLNDLPDGANVRAGHRLIVPDVEPVQRAAADTERPVVGVPADTFVYADRRRVFYRVADGDELSEIAHFFRVTTDELRMWNRISTDAKLQRGMFLQLYVPKDAELSQCLVLTPNEVRTMVVGSEEFFDFHESQQNRVRVRYRVKPGDTLRSLAERFDLSVGSIARINQFGREKKLEADSEIIIYMPEQSAKRSASN